MDSASLAASLVASKMAQTQTAVAASMLKMNAQSGAAIADLLQAAQENLQTVAQGANPPGVGGNIDILA